MGKQATEFFKEQCFIMEGFYIKYKGAELAFNNKKKEIAQLEVEYARCIREHKKIEEIEQARILLSETRKLLKRIKDQKNEFSSRYDTKVKQIFGYNDKESKKLSHRAEDMKRKKDNEDSFIEELRVLINIEKDTLKKYSKINELKKAEKKSAVYELEYNTLIALLFTRSETKSTTD